jgi:hypothetical protein
MASIHQVPHLRIPSAFDLSGRESRPTRLDFGQPLRLLVRESWRTRFNRGGRGEKIVAIDDRLHDVTKPAPSNGGAKLHDFCFGKDAGAAFDRFERGVEIRLARKLHNLQLAGIGGVRGVEKNCGWCRVRHGGRRCGG